MATVSTPTQSASSLQVPLVLSDLLLYRLSRLQATAGGMALRYCEGQFGITRREWRILALLAAVGPLGSSDLAERASLDRPRTSKAVTSLLEPEESEAAPAAPEFTPAVSVRKSLASKDHIISLIDGKPYKALRRHLSGQGLTPDEYRARYGLKPDYPMVSESYSQVRREMAKKIGLGRKPGTKVSPKAKAAPKPAPKPRGRPRKISA